MSAVDVVAVFDELEGREGFCGESDVRRMKIRESRSAVAELLDIKDCANSLVTGLVLGQVNHHHMAELCRLLGRQSDTSAALARCKGEGA